MLVRMGSIPMKKTCIMLLRMGSIPVWGISMEIISTKTRSRSLLVPIRAYKRLNIFAILSIVSIFVGPEHQASKIYEYLTKRHIKSNQHMYNPHAFSNYVKTTFNNGLSLSEADLSHLVGQTTKHGSSRS